MLKKTITYSDYNGQERTDDFYFNLTKTELLEMDSEYDGGMEACFRRYVATDNNKALFQVFKNMVLKSYGEKSYDGKRFEKKNGELAAAFAETNAYDVLMMELATDIDAATAFFTSLIPADLKDKMDSATIAK